MKNSTTIILLLIIVGSVGAFMLRNNNVTATPIETAGTDSQNIILSFKNYNYYPNTIKVKVNQPVRISLDSSVTGCYRAFTILEFGISKYLKSPKDYVEFTPAKTGTFKFSCAMGMGTGKLIVE